MDLRLLSTTLPPQAHILTLYAGMESDEREDGVNHTDNVLMTAEQANAPVVLLTPSGKI